MRDFVHWFEELTYRLKQSAAVVGARVEGEAGFAEC